MFKEKKSFFERITKMINSDNSDEIAPEEEEEINETKAPLEEIVEEQEEEEEETAEEGQMTIDVFQTPTEIIIQTMAAGVKPENLEVSINREMVTIRGKRERARGIAENDYFFRELYWGTFARTVVLPEEVDVEASEATEQNGLVTVRLPKIDKKKTQKLKVKGR